jgi:hypothetical protein
MRITQGGRAPESIKRSRRLGRGASSRAGLGSSDGPADVVGPPALACTALASARDPARQRLPAGWAPPRSPFKLIEEWLWHQPWQLLVACILLNKVSERAHRACGSRLTEPSGHPPDPATDRCPAKRQLRILTEMCLCQVCSRQEIEDGHARGRPPAHRSSTIRCYPASCRAGRTLPRWPRPMWTNWSTSCDVRLLYMGLYLSICSLVVLWHACVVDWLMLCSVGVALGLHRNRSRSLQRFSHEYLHKSWRYPIELHGVGKYGNDAYRIFCLGEWRDARPTDKELRKYIGWLENHSMAES